MDEKKLSDVKKLRDELTQKLSPEINMTSARMAEVDAIRNEILNAVNHQKYAPSALLPKADKASVSTAKDPILKSPLWDQIHHSRKHIYDLVSSKQTELELPKNVKFLGKFNLHSNSYRDVIDLVEVQENLNFEFDEQVLVWRTIPHTLSGNKHLLLGLTNTSLVLAKLVDGLFQFVDELKISDNELNANGFEAFLRWNNKDGHSEGYAIVAADDELVWIRLGNEGMYNKLEITWRWQMHKLINKFKYFKHNNESMVFLSNQDSPSLDIYRFNLDNKDFSQIQVIPLNVPCKNIALVEWKKQLLLALPLNNTTQIYKYSEKFSLIKTVPSKGVTSVAGFQAGGLCFFAIGGDEPQILRYRHNGLSSVKVISKTYQFVRSYVPIAIHTFRDDVLLLVQFEVTFDSHTLSRISTLRWNGEAFETFFNVPCYMEEVLHYNGVSCLIDADQSGGLSGSVVLTKSNNVSILVPRKAAKSGLFDLKIEIRAAPHPKEEKLIEIQMMFDYFSQLKAYNDEVFQKAIDTIKKAVLPDKELVVSGTWTVDVLNANEVVPEKKWEADIKEESSSKSVITSEDLFKTINETGYEIYSVLELVKNAVPEVTDEDRSEMAARNHPTARNAPLQLHGIRAENFYCETINGISRDDIVWRLEDELNMVAPLEVQSLAVLHAFEGTVNGIDLAKDLVHSQSNVIQGNAAFAQLDVARLSSATDINDGLLEAISRNGNQMAKLTVDELFVDGDFLVDQINGIDWWTASRQMIRRDVSPGNLTLIVDGVST